MKVLILLLGLALSAYAIPTRFDERAPALPCNATACGASPNCQCSSTAIPGNIPPTNTPQFVLLTFDDAITVGNVGYYREALRNRKNPNNCSISATFFVSHEYTDYSLVHELNADGHEISLHSISHVSALDYWTNANVATLKKEFADQRALMAKFANISEIDIKGIRMPFLQMAGNNQYQMLKESGFTYDLSWTTQQYMAPGLWPYTTEYTSIQDCLIGLCPTESYSGVWTIPMINWEDQSGNVCAMLDACVNIPNTTDGLVDWMKAEFNKQYTGNRAPVGLYTHAAWFNVNETRFEAYKKFLDYLGTLKDVYIVKASQVIDWVKAPKTVAQMIAPPITCHRTSAPTCSARACRLIKEGTEERYMTACVSQCPNTYPWLDNPLGDKTF